MKKNIYLSIFFIFIIISCKEAKKNPKDYSGNFTTDVKSGKYKVIFIEVGSVNCIPCRMMQKVLKQTRTKYKNQVKVIFYDVWTKQGKSFAKTYGIRTIPTQIFLDSKGKEYFRHIGFYPFEKVEKVLWQQGVQ